MSCNQSLIYRLDPLICFEILTDAPAGVVHDYRWDVLAIHYSQVRGAYDDESFMIDDTYYNPSHFLDKLTVN